MLNEGNLSMENIKWGLQCTSDSANSLKKCVTFMNWVCCHSLDMARQYDIAPTFSLPAASNTRSVRQEKYLFMVQGPAKRRPVFGEGAV
jgi:hypothetical protein